MTTEDKTLGHRSIDTLIGLRAWIRKHEARTQEELCELAADGEEPSPWLAGYLVGRWKTLREIWALIGEE